MAIKGKTKRSQGRPVRRPAAGPRIHTVERRQPWYQAPAFALTLAVVVLLATVAAAGLRVQEGRVRSDIRRFTALLRPAMTSLNQTVTGTSATPGFASAAALADGRLKPADLANRARTWQVRLQQVKSSVDGILIGGGPSPIPGDGRVANSVGGHLPMLGSVRDAYASAVQAYVQAAHLFQLAGQAPAKGPLAQDLVNQAQDQATAAATALDAAATMLARLTGDHHLDVTVRMPGESQAAYSARYAKAAPPTSSAGG